MRFSWCNSRLGTRGHDRCTPALTGGGTPGRFHSADALEQPWPRTDIRFDRLAKVFQQWDNCKASKLPMGLLGRELAAFLEGA